MVNLRKIGKNMVNYKKSYQCDLTNNLKLFNFIIESSKAKYTDKYTFLCKYVYLDHLMVNL